MKVSGLKGIMILVVMGVVAGTILAFIENVLHWDPLGWGVFLGFLMGGWSADHIDIDL
jgi:uncharacterized membrane protein YadS